MGLGINGLSQSARALGRTPGVWILAVVALALGIGANATVFTAIRGSLLRPLELLPAGTVAMVSTNTRQAQERAPASMKEYLAWRDHLQSFSDVVAYEASRRTVSGGGEPERLQAMRVSEGYFRFFNLTPALGRFMSPEESHSGRDGVAVLSYGLWQRRFGGRSDVVGEKLQLDDATYTIAGVASAKTVLLAESVQVWLPLVTEATPEAQLSRRLGVWGRLKPGVPIARAQQEMEALSANLERENPQVSQGWKGRILAPIDSLLDRPNKVLIAFMYIIAAGILLITCANVGNLMLARAVSRQGEIALRAALGASRLQLAREMLTESLLLAVPAAAIGLLVALFSARALVGAMSGSPGGAAGVALDGKVLAFVLSVTVTSIVLFGFAPLWYGARLQLSNSLREGGSRAGLSGKTRRLTRAFVALEVAASAVVMITGLIMTKDIRAIEHLNLGFQTSDMIMTEVNPAARMYADESAVRGLYDRLLKSVRNVGGVTAASAMSVVPCFGGDGAATTFSSGDLNQSTQRARMSGAYISAMPESIETLRLQLVRGRGILPSDRDNTMKVVVVNETAATRLWPGQSPIGKRVQLDALGGGWFSVIGEYRNVVRFNLTLPPQPQFVVPWAQSYQPAMALAIRTSNANAAMAGVRRALRDADPSEPFALRTMEAAWEHRVNNGGAITWLFGVFSAIALFLAAIGLFGLVWQSVNQRRREIGIRVALGAGDLKIVSLFMRQVLVLACAGLMFGGAVSVGIGTMLQSVVKYALADARAADPTILATAAVVTLGVTGLACIWPVRRAIGVDPVAILRD
jgi:putative ABC transport system permease protein